MAHPGQQGKHMSMPEFSLIITTYNSSRTIDEALNSVATLEESNSIEVIISDDASSDDTVERIMGWSNSHLGIFHNIIVLPNRENRGISGNHTLAFRHATAQFATYIGGDDYFIRRDYFRRLRQHVSPDLRIAKTDLLSVFDDTGNSHYTFHEVMPFFSYPLSMQKRLMCLVGNIIAGGPGTIFHLPTLKQLGYFGENIRVFEDFQVYLAFLFAGHRIQMMPIQGIAWRRHSGSLSYSQKERMLQAQEQVFNDYIRPHLNLLPFWTRYLSEMRYAFPAGIWVKLLCPLWWSHLLRLACGISKSSNPARDTYHRK